MSQGGRGDELGGQPLDYWAANFYRINFYQSKIAAVAAAAAAVDNFECVKQLADCQAKCA